MTALLISAYFQFIFIFVHSHDRKLLMCVMHRKLLMCAMNSESGVYLWFGEKVFRPQWIIYVTFVADWVNLKKKRVWVQVTNAEGALLTSVWTGSTCTLAATCQIIVGDCVLNVK